MGERLKDTLVLINGSGKCATVSLFESFNKLETCTLQKSHDIYHPSEPGGGAIRGKKVIDVINNNLFKNYVIIEVYRDIIDRKIASFFQNLKRTHIQTGRIDIINKVHKHGIEFLTKRFDVLNLENYWSCDQWKNAFKYDVMKVPFDFKKKYQIYKKDNFHFVNLRYSDIKQWNSIIRSLDVPIPNISKFSLVSSNVGIRKWYRHLYISFKENYKINEGAFNEIFKMHQHMIEHFSTSEECQQFRRKWLG